ncbi:dUTP diphosphatase [Vibrio crassostreae]|uniref:dUTP diphosphatase n=1 Tax=Vibrio crassostreae TaxID=246167 RepID=UPI001B3151C9|nr:hypothetical protein [Vibrio crassostreae]
MTREMIQKIIEDYMMMPPVDMKPLVDGFLEPEQGTERSAAIDLKAQYDFEIRSDKKNLVKLGFAAAIPKGYCALLMPRSGQGSKAGVHLTNTIGLIDDDYRDEWMASVHLDQFKDNIGDAEILKEGTKVLKVKKGERFIQCLFVKKELIKLNYTDDLDETERKGGFGHTNK